MEIAFVAAVSEGGDPSEDDLAGVEDRGVPPQEFRDRSALELTFDLPIRHPQRPLLRLGILDRPVEVEQGGNDVARGLRVGAHPPLSDQITVADPSVVGRILGREQPIHGRPGGLLGIESGRRAPQTLADQFEGTIQHHRSHSRVGTSKR